MNCKTIEEIFEKYMDAELYPEAETEIERHISGCPDCAAKYENFIKIKRGLSSIEDEPLPAQFHSAWAAKIYENVKPQTVRPNKFFKFMPAIAAGIAAVAIVSGALLSGVLTQAPGSAAYSMEAAASVQDSSLAGGAAPGMQEESTQQQNAAQAEDGSLFMAQIAPSEAASGETEAAAAPSDNASAKSAADAAAEPLQIFIAQETFNSLIADFDENQLEYNLDGENVFISVNDENQDAIASVFKDNALELCAVSGAIFEFSISE